MSLLARRLQAGVASGGGGSFSPDDVSGLVVWLDADAITGLSDTDPVSSWANLITTDSETYDQANGLLQPTYRAAVQNGLPAVRFDGSARHLDGSVTRTQKPVTAFVAINWSGSNDRFILGNTGFNQSLVSRVLSAKFNFHHEGVGGLNPSSTSNVPSGTASVWDYSYASDGAYLFGFNGVDDGSGTNDATINASPICIGARDSGSNYWHGDIFEVLVYDNVLSSGDRQDVRDYLTTKWGI